MACGEHQWCPVRATLGCALLVPLLLITGSDPSPERTKRSWINVIPSKTGATTRVTERSTSSSPASRRRTVAEPRTSSVRFESRWVLACGDDSVATGSNEWTCSYAVAACEGLGPGPLTYQWRRPVAPTLRRWQLVGSTCYGPGEAAPPRPGVTVDVVRSAFARTPFRRPVLIVQPPGGVTLIRLDTFFQASFPGTGYGSGQIHTVTLLGRSVRIRVSAAEYRWDFGDGSPVLSTTSAGGPWPDGDVRHVYTRPGEYTVQAKVVYRGDFSVEGGPWLPVHSTVPLAAPPVRLIVATAHNELLPLE